jgi:predicted PurR-regulated permease PerM
MKRWFQRVILSRRWATFLVLGLSFLVFGATSLNLLFIAKANFELIVEHGWQALMDGGAHQLLEVLATGYLSMGAYVVFKSCEARLVHWLVDPPES